MSCGIPEAIIIHKIIVLYIDFFGVIDFFYRVMQLLRIR